MMVAQQPLIRGETGKRARLLNGKLLVRVQPDQPRSSK